MRTNTATAPMSDATTVATATEMCVAGAPAGTARIADLDPNDPVRDRCSVCFCAVVRLVKAALAAVVIAGTELAAAQRELDAGFERFVAVDLPLNPAEAKAMIRFAAEAGVQAEGLTPAHDVPLARLLEAVATLGKMYTKQVNQCIDK